ncbi:MAG TPA: serine hydrolase domain-containing protein [Candidatus Eisenbacteria bacterium]|nr:serine hydrolase domain-containing protein [Candidatus Eisenbacteria bacterium]
MTAAMARNHVPGGVLVAVRDTAVLLARGYGVADDRGTRVDPERTIFRVASVSKVFTATAAMRLVERGRLALDEDVNRHLRRFHVPENSDPPVTLLHLLTHTAGFDDRNIARKARGPEGALPLGEYLARRLPDRIQPPGRFLCYSNHGMALAGYLVEEVSGIPFARFMQDSLFAPLGMTRSSFAPRPMMPADLAVGHDDSDPPHPIAFDYVQTAPASMMTSTGSDVARFMIAHLEGGEYRGRRMLGAAAVGEMHRRQFAQHERLPGVALGFWERFQNGERALWHDGDGAGFASLLYLLPEQGTGFFLAFNGSGGGAAREEVLAALLDRFFPDQRPIARPTAMADAAREARRCAGTYAFNRYGHRGIERFVSLSNRIEVRVDSGGTLSLRGTRFTAIAPGLFQRTDGHSVVAFDPAAGGSVRHMFTGGGIARVYERVPWYATAIAQAILLGYCILVFLAMLVSAPVAALVRRGRAEVAGAKPRPGPRRVAITVSALGVLFLAGLAAGIGSGLEYGVPPWFTVVMALPLVLIGAAFVCLLGMRVVWSDSAASRGWRFGYTLVAAAGLGFVAWLAQWDLIRFRF